MNDQTSAAEIKAFIAKLANNADWEALTPQSRETLYTEFQRWWVSPASEPLASASAGTSAV